jgi:TonB-linked SusC/RagA family outer membrane protein
MEQNFTYRRKVPYQAYSILLLMFLLLFGTSESATAQSGLQVSGTVTAQEDDQPLPGVTVLVKGTTVGTVTDIDGKFSIESPDENGTLVFSFIGYAKLEVPIEGRKEIEVTMATDVQSLQEVVVVGYGTQKKVNLTGSVSTISDKDLTAVPVANTTTALAGKLPGLIAMQRSGEPGLDNADLSIRGFDNALVVVDGIVGRDFSRLDPNEIESITILKDAASTAVYGVSGGNGVILVTTKKGTLGKPEFSYNMNYGVQTVTKYPRFVNSAEYAILKNEASTNLGGDLIYSEEEIQKFREGTDPNYPNYDYYDHFVKDYAPQRQQNISVRGGSENIQYFFLLGESKQEAMWKAEQDYGRYNFRTNVDAKINDNLKISVGLGARTENRNNLIQNSYLMASWLQYQWPIFTPYTPDGKVAATNYGLAAYLEKDLTGYIHDKRNNIQGDLTISYELPFVEGLTARVTAAQDLAFREEKQWLKQYKTHTWNEATQSSVQVGSRGSNQLILSDWKSSSVRLQTSLNYTRTFADKHNVSGLLLYEEYENEGTSFWASRTGYVVPIDQIFAGPDLNKNNNGSAYDNGRQSLVGRANYDYLGKYLIEYSFRYDGSAKFPVDKRWGLFSGVSAGWRLSEENFIRDNFSSIDNLKLRASWGQSGDDNTGNFQFLTGYSYPSRSYILGNNIVSSGMVDTGVPNPNITWEESEMYNLGLDLSLWDRLLEVEADVFYRERGGILARRNLQLPSTFGATLPYENLNSDNTRGFELILTHSNNIGELKYVVSPNVSFTRSKWDHVEQREYYSQYDSWRNNIENRWKNIYWGLKSIGQFQSEEEINSSPIQDDQANSTLRPGDIKYQDYNNDGVIDNSDNQIIGRGQSPEIFYGIGMNLEWRNFSLSMTWQGASNFNVRQTHYLIQPFANGMNAYAYFMDRWHREDMTDPDSKWIPGKYPSTINNGAPNNRLLSDFWVKDASYLRLKFINLSYNLELDALERIGIQRMNISLSGQNVLTFSDLGPIDPEAPTGRLSYYPQQKTYNLGINVVF